MEKWETFSKNDLQKIVDRLDKAEGEGSNLSCGTILYLLGLLGRQDRCRQIE